jgi:hypothetical protein
VKGGGEERATDMDCLSSQSMFDVVDRYDWLAPK